MDYKKQFEKDTGIKAKGCYLGVYRANNEYTEWLEKQLADRDKQIIEFDETISEMQHVRDMAECVADNRDMRKKIKKILEILEGDK